MSKERQVFTTSETGEGLKFIVYPNKESIVFQNGHLCLGNLNIERADAVVEALQKAVASVKGQNV